MKLEVAKLHWADVYKDIARIPELYRRDKRGNIIPEGRVCAVTIGSRSILLSVRGQLDYPNAAIYIDDKTRLALNIELRDFVDVHLRPVRILGQFLWAWRASDPAYKLAARIGLASIVIGLIGIVLGAMGLKH